MVLSPRLLFKLTIATAEQQQQISFSLNTLLMPNTCSRVCSRGSPGVLRGSLPDTCMTLAINGNSTLSHQLYTYPLRSLLSLHCGPCLLVPPLSPTPMTWVGTLVPSITTLSPPCALYADRQTWLFADTTPWVQHGSKCVEIIAVRRVRAGEDRVQDCDFVRLYTTSSRAHG